LTIKEQVKMYLTHKRPDVFGFMGNLEEKGRLRHYQRMLELLSREFKQYKSVYTTDRSGDRIFILSKSEDVLDNVILTLQDKLEE